MLPSHPPATKDLTVHLPLDVRRKAGAAVSLALLAASVLLAGCSSGPSASTGRAGAGNGSLVRSSRPTGLIPATGASPTTLPPSHDNDAGWARRPDSYPDADIDANQKALLKRHTP